MNNPSRSPCLALCTLTTAKVSLFLATSFLFLSVTVDGSLSWSIGVKENASYSMEKQSPRLTCISGTCVGLECQLFLPRGCDFSPPDIYTTASCVLAQVYARFRVARNRKYRSLGTKLRNHRNPTSGGSIDNVVARRTARRISKHPREPIANGYS
ncbi:hypothetical protein B0H19DRAFT_1169259 [Mycena capillaripes]|nr:hypothetical protein B0H19DRAFT_1169259 [Mycena capillaripes]